MLNENIKTIRKNKGYTQEDLASRLNVTRQTVSKWEKGLSVPDADLLVAMAEIFEVPVEELLGAEKASPQQIHEITEQLSRINEQLAIKNRRARKIWKAVAISIIVLIVVPFVLFLSAAMIGGTAYTDNVTEGQVYEIEADSNS